MATEAMQRNDFETAVQLLEPYCAKYPKADAALTNLGLAYLQSARQDPTRVQKALNVLTTSYNLNKENQNAIYYLAYAYEMSGNSTQAQYLRSMLQQ
jgi:predicted Zn-dependent protease